MRRTLLIAIAALLAFACSSANAGGSAFLLAGHSTKVTAASADAMRGRSMALIPASKQPTIILYDFSAISTLEFDVLVHQAGGRPQAVPGASGRADGWEIPAPLLDPAPRIAEDMRAALQRSYGMSAAPPGGATPADYNVGALSVLWQLSPAFGKIRLVYTVAMYVKDNRDGTVAGATCTYQNLSVARTFGELLSEDMAPFRAALDDARTKCVAKFTAKVLKAG